MRNIADQSAAALLRENAAPEQSSRRLVLLGGLSLYHTALQWLIAANSGHVVVVRPTGAPMDDPEISDADVVLLDLDVEFAHGGRLLNIRTLLDAIGSKPVLLISSGVDPDALQDLLGHGVAGIVLKSSPCDVLLQAIDSVCRGKVWLQRDVLAQTFADSSHTRRSCSEVQKIEQLTAREREIISVACTGLTNRQISERLYVSEATVRHHLSSIFSKLGVANRGELIVFAYRHRLLDPRDMEKFC